jgi:hypothetical protein
LIATILLAGCAKRPANVVEDFYRAVESGRQDEALSMVSPEVTGMMGEQKMRGVLSKKSQEWAQCGGIKDITTELSGDKTIQRGTVTVVYSGLCEPDIDRIKLVKVNDEWKIGADK